MDIFAFSDWRVQDIDIAFRMVSSLSPKLILYAGDDINRFVEVENQTNYLEELAAHCEYGLGAVIGNDCQPSDRDFISGRKVFELHSSPMEVDDWKIIGLEGGTREGELELGYVLYNGEEIQEHLLKQMGDTPGERLIVVSHVPPSGCLDEGLRFGMRSAGSPALRAFIEEYQPKLVLCGHVHSQGGKWEQIGDTMVVNAASHDHQGARALGLRITILEDGVSCHLFDDRDFSLTLLNGLGAKFRKDLGFFEVSTLDELLDPKNRDAVFAVGGKLAHKWLRHADVIASKKSYAQQRIEIPDNSIFFDIETDQSCSCIWLIGAFQSSGGFTSFLEKRSGMLRENISLFINYLKKHDPPALVSYGPFDLMVKQYMTDEDREYFESIPWIDLLQEVRKSVFLPVSGNKLSTISIALGYEPTFPELTGLEVGCSYSRFLNRGIEPDWEMLLKYNEDDVMAMPFIVEQVNALYESVEGGESIEFSFDKKAAKKLRQKLREHKKEVENKKMDALAAPLFESVREIKDLMNHVIPELEECLKGDSLEHFLDTWDGTSEDVHRISHLAREIQRSLIHPKLWKKVSQHREKSS